MAHKEGDKITVPGYGKGVVIGRPSQEGRVRVRLEDGRIVGYGGKYGADKEVRRAVADELEARGVRLEPGFAGYAAVGPGDNNAGDPLFNGPQDQPLREQPMDDDSVAPGETPVEVAAGQVAEDKKADKKGLTEDEKTIERIRVADKAMRGPRE